MICVIWPVCKYVLQPAALRKAVKRLGTSLSTIFKPARQNEGDESGPPENAEAETGGTQSIGLPRDVEAPGSEPEDQALQPRTSPRAVATARLIFNSEDGHQRLGDPNNRRPGLDDQAADEAGLSEQEAAGGVFSSSDPVLLPPTLDPKDLPGENVRKEPQASSANLPEPGESEDAES